jgi:hypothetical protein
MRVNRLARAALVLGILAGVLGLGTSSAEAATPTRATWYTKDFTVTLNGPFRCSNIKSGWEASLSTPAGTEQYGMNRWFSCTSGSRVIRLDYRADAYYGTDGWASENHLFSLSWAPSGGSLFPSCGSDWKQTELRGTYNQTTPAFYNQLYLQKTITGSCGGVSLSANVTWAEGLAVS